MTKHRKTSLALMAIVTTAASGFALRRPAPPAFALHSDVTLPFELVSQHVFLSVTVNGSRPLAFVLDTGDKYAIVDLDRARELGLTLGRPIDVGGVGAEPVVGAFVQGSSFALPGVPGFSQPVTLAVPLKKLASQLGHDFDGILGADFITEFVLALNYQTHTITLHDANTFAYAGPGERVPIRLNPSGHPVIEGSVTPLGGSPIAGRFVLDIGAGGSLTLFSPFVAEHQLPSPGTKTIAFVSGGGTGGDTVGKIGRVAELRIGQSSVVRPITNFSEDKAGAFASSAAQGNIGADVLSRFTLLFDYGHNRIIFEPTAAFSAPFDRAFSGLRIEAEGADYKTYRIKTVRGESPAALAGLDADDIVTAVDGRPASELTLSVVLEILERPAPHRVTVQRGGQTINIGLTPAQIGDGR